MKIKIDIIIGMLGSGKTSYINSLLKSGIFKDETIIIIQNEQGRTELNYGDKPQVIILCKDNEKDLDEKYIKDILKNYYPDRILIECNGMENVNKIFDVFQGRYLRKLTEINVVATTINSKTFNMFLINMESIVREQLIDSDIILLTNISNIDKNQMVTLRRNIRGFNNVAKIIDVKRAEDIGNFSKNEVCITEELGKSKSNKITFTITVSILSFILICLFSLILDRFNIINFDASLFQKFSTLFLGILIETIPFILLGAFVSAIIQFFLPREVLIKIFPKNRVLASIFASVIGVFFPVCDCGTVPVARGFLKRGVHLSAVVTFIFAAPIVNPIAIMSSIYAFQDNKEIVVYRVILGITVAIIVGLLVSKNKTKDIITDNLASCDCDLCNGDYNINLFTKVKGIFIHAGDEFFNIGKFMIIGAFLCSIMQIALKQEIFTNFPSSGAINILIMIIFSFIFSVCSTSDSFVAKGFMEKFTTNSVLGFLVLGPMIAIKNTMILLGSFKKEFVFKLLFIVISITFTLLILLEYFI